MRSKAALTMMQRSLLAVLVVAVVAGAWVRVNGMNDRWIWGDEAVSLLHVEGRVGAGIDASANSHTFGAIAAQLSKPGPGGVEAVVSALAADDPGHSPLYYVVQRGWNDAGGRALSRRALPVMLGLVAVATIAWFAAVLSGVEAGIIAAALALVSPFFVLYGQQIREYSLWGALVALSSGLAVRATRRRGARPWVTYATASALALWTSPFSVLLAPAHVVYAAFVGGRRSARNCVIAYAAAFATYVPWLAVMVVHRHEIAAANAWSATPYPFPALVAKLAFTLSSAFTDLVYADPRGALASAAVLIVLAAAAVFLVRTQRETALALGAIAASSAGTLFVLDLIAGTHRSANSRYLAPLVLVAIVTVAAALARLPARRAVLATAMLVAVGAWSSAVGTSSPVWWDNHGDASWRDVARTLARTGAPPVVYERGCSELITLSLAAPPGETVRCNFNDPSRAQSGWDVLSPSVNFLARARAAGITATPVANQHERAIPGALAAFRRQLPEQQDSPQLEQLRR